MPLGRFGSFRLRTTRREAEVEPARAPEPSNRPLLVAGFGNPDDQYARTRHNVGAWCLALLARRHGVELKREGRVSSARVDLGGHALHLARARSYYNEAGGPLVQELRRLKGHPTQLLVLLDDLDLPVGQVRMRTSGGTGGNNGMKSISNALGTQEFARIRIGIDRPYDHGAPVRDPERVAAWVLASPTGEERRALEAALERVADAVELAATEGYEAAMRFLHQEPGAPAPPPTAPTA
ncbi:MAG: aminoacyl-tRNA hydrolase [Chloroflexi bacterium]|nr:aminoacyl-tRNA hydrolase [Chloroflexota bacterium]MDA1240621.1 aminoacyl-tRNA hydrolase [Chloroflexota bacterium]